MIGKSFNRLFSSASILYASLLCISNTEHVLATENGKRDLTGKYHVVTVGKGNFMYEPNNITAAVGDVVVFQFYPTNHSVIQGAYCGNIEGGCNPCIPIDLMDSSVKGFASQNFLTTQDADPNNLTVSPRAIQEVC
jgi:plastocyanin